MKGLENMFSGAHIVLWRTEYTWKEELSGGGKKALLLNNTAFRCEKMHLAAIVVDTKSFIEVRSYHHVIPTPFALHNKFIRLNLFLDKEPEIITESPLVSLSRDFLDWAQGLELYSWGEDCKIISQNINSTTPIKYAETIKFHDIRHLFKAYGIPADNYLSSTVLHYFDQNNAPDAHTPLDNCRLLATALKKLAKTV